MSRFAANGQTSWNDVAAPATQRHNPGRLPACMRAGIAWSALLTGLVVGEAARAQASPSDFTTGHRYDALRREVGTILADPDGAGPAHYQASRNTYDAAGRLVRVEKGELSAWQAETILPQSWTGFVVLSQIDTEYDPTDRKIKDTASSAGVAYNVTQYSYDATGRLECTAVRMNSAAFGSLPASACALGTQGTQGPDRVTRNIYDAAGRLTQIRRAVGTSYEQAYVTYGYTADGKQEFVVDANGNKARMTYDGLDRQAQWQFPSPSAPSAYDPSTPASALATSGAVSSGDFEAYGYDANGNRTSLRKRDGRTFGYSFDALGRLTSKIVPDACVAGYACTNVPASKSRDVYYSYDLRGLQIAARFDSAAGGDAVTQTYDGFGRLSSSMITMGGFSATIGYEHDPDGNRTRVTYPDGNFAGYHYDGLDRLDTVGVNGSSGLLARYYDAAGHLAQNLSGSWTNYSYDGIGRLTGQNEALAGGTGSVNASFAYNPAGQIVTRTRSNDAYAYTAYASANRTYAVNGLNQYSAAGGVGFGYDSNGNLTASGSTAYTYDAENRLVSASSGTDLVYDPLGRLFQTSVGGVGVTRFLYAGDELVAEYDGANNMIRRYIHGPGEDDPLASFDSAVLGGSWSNARLPKPDYQGSIVLWTDWNGGLAQINSYDEYGIPGTGNWGRFQYTGQAWIPELGMYYYKARIYSPTLGRFLQTDPIGYGDQVNLYAYVANDPIDGRDPTGLCYDRKAVCHYTEAETTVLLNTAYKEATAGRGAGLANIYRNSTDKYDFGMTPRTMKDTWTYKGRVMDASQMGNFIAGFQGAAYDKKYNGSVPLAQAIVEGAGVYYHATGQTKAKNDPLDLTGMPDIKKGEAAGMVFVPGENVLGPAGRSVPLTPHWRGEEGEAARQRRDEQRPGRRSCGGRDRDACGWN